MLAALALVAAACGGPEDAAAPEEDDDPTEEEETTEEPGEEPTEEPEETEEESGPTFGGTAVWGYDQEPNILNPKLSDGTMFATSQIALSVLLPLWIITPEFSYVPSPLLESAEPSAAGVEPFSVTYNLNPDATWSDGVPITAGDVFFNLQVCLDERWDIVSRAGCDKVDMEATEAALDPESKTIEVVYIEVYAPWQTMFSTASGVLFPRHLLEDADINTVWNEEITVASGPFMFEGWEAGQQLSIVRNENYETYAGRNAYLDRVVFRFIPDSDTQVQQLRGGEIDLIYPQPQLDLVQQVNSIANIATDSTAGPTWEHLDFQHSRPPLDQRYVRQAIAKGIDRDTFIEQFIVPLMPDAQALNSIIFMNNSAPYEPHFAEHIEYDPAGAIAILEENGCVRGDDDVFVCEGERLSFEWTSTAGNERRELFFEVAQQSLREIGVEVLPDFGEAATVFAADKLQAGNWDLFNFGWVGSPDPASAVELWKCGGAQNYHQHCPADEVNEILESTHQAVDPEERMSLFNEASALLAADIPILPLYQQPKYLAWNSSVVDGLADNPTQWGIIWNIADWYSTAN
jgi:peptide/nickel transport system substrate-binding protein